MTKVVRVGLRINHLSISFASKFGHNLLIFYLICLDKQSQEDNFQFIASSTYVINAF